MNRHDNDVILSFLFVAFLVGGCGQEPMNDGAVMGWPLLHHMRVTTMLVDFEFKCLVTVLRGLSGAYWGRLVPAYSWSKFSPAQDFFLRFPVSGLVRCRFPLVRDWELHGALPSC